MQRVFYLRIRVIRFYSRCPRGGERGLFCRSEDAFREVVKLAVVADADDTISVLPIYCVTYANDVVKSDGMQKTVGETEADDGHDVVDLHENQA